MGPAARAAPIPTPKALRTDVNMLHRGSPPPKQDRGVTFKSIAPLGRPSMARLLYRLDGPMACYPHCRLDGP